MQRGFTFNSWLISVHNFLNLAVLLILLAMVASPGMTNPHSVLNDVGRQALIQVDYTQIPLYFIPNHDQTFKQVTFYLQGKDKLIYFTPEGLVFSMMMSENLSLDLAKSDSKRWN